MTKCFVIQIRAVAPANKFARKMTAILKIWNRAVQGLTLLQSPRAATKWNSDQLLACQAPANSNPWISRAAKFLRPPVLPQWWTALSQQVLKYSLSKNNPITKRRPNNTRCCLQM